VKRLEKEFVRRCKDIGVPRSVLNAGWHQVKNEHLTMIVVKKLNGDIHMWFRKVTNLK